MEESQGIKLGSLQKKLKSGHGHRKVVQRISSFVKNRFMSNWDRANMGKSSSAAATSTKRKACPVNPVAVLTQNSNLPLQVEQLTEEQISGE